MATSVRKLLENKKIDNVISVRPETTVIEAISLMAENNIGSILVMEGEELKGIFSERDYIRKGIVQGRKAKSTTMEEVMTPNVFTVSPTMSIVDCMELMSNKKFRHLPVKENEKVIGVLSVGDIVTALLKEQKNTISYLENYISG